MANRFDNAQVQGYVSNYVPLPLEMIGRIAQNQEAKTADLLSKAEQAKGLLNIKADPLNVPYRNKLQKAYNDKLTSLSQKIVKEGYTPENQSLVSNTVNSIINDPQRLALEDSYKNYETYSKDREAYIKDKKYHKYYEPYWNRQGSEEGVLPFTYKGMLGTSDYTVPMSKLISGIKADGSAFEGYRKDSTGKLITNQYGQITKNGKDWEGITQTKLWNTAKNVSKSFLRTPEAQWFIDEHLGGNTGMGYDDLRKVEMEIDTVESYKDKKTGKTLTRPIKKKITAQEYIEDQAAKEMFRIGSPQLFSKSSTSEDLQNLSEYGTGKLDEETFAKNRPTYENPATGVENTPTKKDALNYLGINTGGLNDKAELSGGILGTSGILNTLGEILNLKAMGISIKSDTSLYEKTIKDMVTTASRLGIEIPKYKQFKDNKEVVDIDKLATVLADYGTNLMVKGTTSQGLQAKVSNDISNMYLGETTLTKDGETKVIKSNILETSKVTEIGTGKDANEQKDMLATSGRIIGPNYFGNNNGELRIDMDNKAYSMTTPDKTLQKMTENTWKLTNDLTNAAKGKVIMTKDENNKDVPLSQLANKYLNSILSQARQKASPELAARYEQITNSLEGSKPIGVYSADHDNNIVYVTFQNVDNNVPVDKVIKIDFNKQAAMTLTDINSIHRENTDYIEPYLKYIADPKNRTK